MIEEEVLGGVGLIPKGKLKVLLGDTLEDGSELSVLRCGASRERRVLVFETVPETNKKNLLKSNGYADELYYRMRRKRK